MFSRIDFERAKREGRLDWGEHGTLEDTSVNVSIGEVWTMRSIHDPIGIGPATEQLPLETILSRYYKPKPIDPETGAWRFSPDEYCLAFLKDPFHLDPGMFGQINSRSSYARLGLAITHADDDFQLGSGFDDKLCVSIKPYTHCLLWPDEKPAQLTIEAPIRLTLKRTPLTLHKKLLIYDGKTVVSKRDKESLHRAFSEFILPPQGFCFPPGFKRFFLASTREIVEIPKNLVGYLPFSFGVQGETIPSFTLHTNAPWIMPTDRLHITLEGRVKFPGARLWPGMPLPTLLYRHVKTPLENPRKSRYYGQNEATLPR